MIKRRGLAKLLRFKDSMRKGVIGCAVSNSRTEILSGVLKFSEEVFGETFVDEIVQSEDYTFAIRMFLIDADVDRIRGLLSQLQSDFGNEIEVLFDANLEFEILSRTLWIEDESRNTFRDGIALFVEYFGIEELREVLLIRDSYGDHLMQCLVTRRRNVLENLGLVSDVLGDRIKMKCFLQCKDGRLRNIFHFVAANRYVDFGHVVQFCYDYLEKNEIEELLAGADDTGVNVLHLLLKHKSSGSLIAGLNLIQATLSDDDRFKWSLRSKDIRSVNAFHLVAVNENEINVSFLDSHLNQSEIKDLLIARDANDRTCLHFGANLRSTNLPFLVEYSHEMLKNDGSGFEELILAEDCNGETFLHLLVENYSVCSQKAYDFMNTIMKSLKQKLPDDVFTTLLRLKNKEGKTFLQKENITNKVTIECLKTILEENLSVELLQ